MMITWVGDLFKDIHGWLEFDWDSCLEATFDGEIDATRVWTGEPDTTPIFKASTSSISRVTQATSLSAASIRSRLTRPAWASRRRLFLGGEGEQWERCDGIAFAADMRLNRQDFGVALQDHLPGGGVVVSDEIEIALDVEAIHLGDLEEPGRLSSTGSRPR
jgi:hypothetical protein